VAGLQDWLGGKARSGLDAYLAWRDGPSAVGQLDEAFPQAAPQPGKSVAEVAPPRTSLSPEQWDALGNFNWSATFGGEGAATADLGALAKAKALAKEGHDPRSVWGETGWFKGPEDRWKFEIDDSAAKIGRLSGPERTAPLGEVLGHDQLHAAYPGLADIPTTLRRFEESGSYNPSPEAIEAAGIRASDRKSALLHETQHAIQQREGFATGASPDPRSPNHPGPFYGGKDVETAWRTKAEAEAILADPKASFWEKTEAGDRLSRMDAAIRQAAEYAGYQRSAGEAEARAVQQRRSMTPEQRRAKFPLDSYDVPLDQLITRKPGWFPG
jgi:hypothetical protein